MNMKRVLVLGILGLFFVSMMGGVLGVDGEEIGQELGKGVGGFVTGVASFVQTLLGPFFGDNEIWSRFFMAILLGMVIYSIIAGLFKDSNVWIKWGITISVTFLALLGLPAGFLETIRVQYGAMGATILTLIPFIIVFIFSLQTKYLVITRVTWLFYAGYYFGMYSYEVATHGGWFSGEKALPYMVAWIVGLFLFFGIKSIRNMLFEGKVEGLMEQGIQKVERRAVLQKIKDEDLEKQPLAGALFRVKPGVRGIAAVPFGG